MEYKLYRTDDLKEFESLDEAVFYAKKHDVEYITESTYTDDDITTKKVWNKVDEAKYDLNDAIKRFNAKMSKKNKEVKSRITGEPVNDMAFFNKAMGSSDGGESVSSFTEDASSSTDDVDSKLKVGYSWSNKDKIGVGAGSGNTIEYNYEIVDIKGSIVYIKCHYMELNSDNTVDTEATFIGHCLLSRLADKFKEDDNPIVSLFGKRFIDESSVTEGAEGRREPGFEYVIYDSDEANEKAPIVAIRSTRVEAEHFINVNDFGKRKYEHLDYERVPKGKFHKGDDFWGPFDKDYNRI